MKNLLLLTSFLLIGALTSFGQAYNMDVNGGAIGTGSTINGCSGTISEGAGNYANNESFQITLCAPAGQVIQLNFTTWTVEGCCDYLTVFDNSTNSGTQLFYGNGSSNPGTITGTGQCITLTWTTDGSVTYAGWIASISCFTPGTCSDGIQNQNETGIDCGGTYCYPCTCFDGVQNAGETGIDCGNVCGTPCPCDIVATATPVALPCGGGAVTIGAIGQGETSYALNNDFNGGAAGTGWTVSPAGQFDNPCDPSVDGGTYMWMGATTAAPRTLETSPLDVSCGGDICFYLDMATQGGASPCEGPDLANEGVYLEYSIDGGATWVTINYFQPNAGGAAGTITAWNQYCFTIPPAAETAGTQFHWFQNGSSGTCCDHWGIDNVTISSQSCNPYVYDWTSVPGGTTFPNDSTATTNITATTNFTVCYTNNIDDTCCTTITVVVGALDPLVVAGTDEVCLGASDGTITINAATGGTAAYTYDIGGPMNVTQVSNGSFTGLLPGVYTITVTDAAGCQSFSTWTILVGVSCCPMTNTEAFTDVSCFGANDGTITLTENLGAPVVTFSIDNGATSQVTGNFTGLGPGTYNVLITDGNACTYTSVIVIAEPALIVITDVVVDATCGLNNGTITLTAIGGTGAGYQFSIDGGATFQGTGSYTGLIAGNYNVVVSDGSGCSVVMVVTVNNGGAPSVDAVVITEPSCNGACDGIIVITASGGTGALSYSVDNGVTFQATGTFTGLCDANYDIIVQDGLGCPAIASATLTEPGAINFNSNITDLLCEAVCIGAIDIVGVTGGDGIYQYSIDNGVTFQAGANFTALCAGTYNLVVEDGNGCQGTATAIIVEPLPLILSLTQTDPICSGSCDGIIDLSTAGGTGVIIYSIDASATTTTTPVFTGLCAGTYNCVIEDANGCKLFATVILTDPVAVTFTSVIIDAVCSAANGQIDITAAGGDGVYSYSFDNGATYGASNQMTGAAAGLYDVIVQDGNGCTDTLTVAISNAGAPTIDSIQFTEPTCAGACDGTITVFATGGSGVIQYSIDGGTTFQTGIVFAGMCSGLTNVMIEDANNCQANSSTTLTDPAAVTYTAATVDLDCFGQCIGEINITGAAGGAGGYQYSIDNGATFQASGSFLTLCAGVYNVVVADANACTATSIETITEPVVLSYAAITTPNACHFSNGACNGTMTLNEAGGTGLMTYSINNGVTFQASNLFTNLCAGTYNVVIMDANGCTVTGTETITQPTALSYTTVIVTTSCGTNNGSVTVTAAGGASGVYTYSIDNGVTYQASNFFNLLPAGAYNICIQDGNGCVFCSVVNVNNDPAQIITSITSTPETCFGSCNGTVNVTVTGGTPAITYGIDGGALQASNVFTGVCAGLHNIETVDASGCTVFGTVTVGGPGPMGYVTVETPVDCFGGCNGIIDFTIAVGGNGAYTYSIDNGVTFVPGSVFTGLCAGNYNLVVQDGNLCSATGTVTITEPPLLTLAFSSTDAICNSYCDGTADAVVAGGVPIYDYTWSTGAPLTSTNVTGLCAGTYNLTVTDANGCSVDTLGFVINEPAPFVITSVVITNELCTGDCQGVVTIVAPGADRFTINGGVNFQTGGTFNGLCAGNYLIQIEDPSGCLTDTTITITSPLPISITPGADTTICNGGTASITATGAGGTLPYTFDWGAEGLGNPISVSPIATAAYSVFVIDANGCNSADVIVNVNVLPPMTILSWADANICPGDSIQIQAESNGGDGNYTYLWTNDQDATTMNTFQEIVSPTTTTQYIITISDGCETNDVTDTVTITVLPTPNLLFSVDNFDGCTPLTVNFSNDTDPTMVSACEWEFGDGTSSTNCNPAHTFTIPGCYDVVLKVQSPDGCFSDTLLTSYICVYDVPVPGFTFGPQPTTIVSSLITFTNTSVNASSYYWDFGYNGENSTDVNPTFYYPDSVPGSYVVCLTATNGSGCDSTVCQTVIIDDEFLLYVPNSFTPNGDGLNDEFRAHVNAYDATSFEMRIFDRWGEELFVSNFPSVGWNGHAKGSSTVAQTDIYVWTIKVKDSLTKEEKVYKGHVTLLK
jgi:gliding motility-associated-like protein